MIYQYEFTKIQNGEEATGSVEATSPIRAMYQVIGKRPTLDGITYAFVYLANEEDDPNSDYSLEWPFDE